MPLLFLCFGYLIIYIIGKPVINFATSAIELISLNDAPEFDHTGTDLFAEKRQQQASDSQSTQSSSTTEKKGTAADSNEEPTTVVSEAGGVEVGGKIASSTIIYPKVGDRFGEVVINKVGINEPLYYGDSEGILSLGAGQYIGSMIPGDLGTTLIGGHNMPSFGKIYYLETGDKIEIQTHYGDYTYEVTEIKVANYKDPIINEKLAEHSKRSLILYTCYPLDAIGLTPERVFVFADYFSGPMIDETA